MSATARKTMVGVIFGGRSVEHDVSVVTGQQIMQAFDVNRYEVVPIYITRDGKWVTGAPLGDLQQFKTGRITDHPQVKPALLSPDVRHHGLIIDPMPDGLFAKPKIQRLDVMFPAVHGSHGEDGTLQGLFELADIPYVGFGTLGSALTNDKIMTKLVLRQQQIPVVEDVWFSRSDWETAPGAILERIEAALPYPVFVKPATLGSSIGVTRADDPAMLKIALDIAANFDRRILVERAITGGIEINCAVMGYGTDLRASVLEQPVTWEEFLSFEAKYLRGSAGMKSAERLIPAPLTAELTARIQQIALDAFRAVDGRGITRIDFLVKPEHNEVYLNEMNTMPGSLAFYLWQASGLNATAVVDHLVQAARSAHAEKRRNMYDYQSNLLAVAAQRGLKGSKSSAKAAVPARSQSPE